MWVFTFRNSHELASRAVGEIWGRQSRSALVWYGGLLAVVLLGWADSAFAPVGWISLGCLVANVFALVNHWHSATQYADDTRDVAVRIDDGGISCCTSISSWQLAWEGVTQVFSTRTFIWVASKLRGPAPFPISAMPQDAFAFIMDHASSPGVK